MSNYKTHSMFSSFIALPICIFLAYKFLSPSLKETLLFSSSFLYATLFMSPDMDLASKIKLRSLRGILTIPFRSYSKIFKHRGISHHLVFGFLTRVIWLGIWAAIILYLSQKPFDMHRFLGVTKTYKKELLWIVSAIILSDASHLLLDKFSKRRP